MKRFKWTSVAVGAVMGVLAVAGVAAVPSAPVQALSSTCQIGNDTDVALAPAYGVAVAVSTVEMPACQAGKGSRVRIDYRIRNLDPQQPIFVQVTAPDGSVHQLQDRTVPGTVDFAESQRWTTQASSSRGTWSLTAASLGANAILDSWKVWVIPGSCWRVNYDDAHSPAEWGEWKSFSSGAQYYWTYPALPASTSVSSACTHFASADMRIRVQLRDVYEHRGSDAYSLTLTRNGANVPMTVLSRTVTADNGDYLSHDVWLGVDGSTLRADGTWTLKVLTGSGHHGITGVTMEQWELHTSY